MAAKPNDMISVQLRMREGLRRHIAAEAKKMKRSANQEMVRRLERSFLADDMREAIQIAAEAAAKMSVEAVLRTLVKRQLETDDAKDSDQ
jgi:hypothetical protein